MAAFAPSHGLGPEKIAVDFTGQEGYPSSVDHAIAVVGSKISYLVWNEPEGHQWELLTVSYARQAK